jgi:hypothetical protein
MLRHATIPRVLGRRFELRLHKISEAIIAVPALLYRRRAAWHRSVLLLHI